jgi:NTE family protein
MAIPLFFEPLYIKNIHDIDDITKRWDKLASYNGIIPNNVSLLDGGLLSGFPIDLFHKPGVPILPTVGVKLGCKARKFHSTSNIFDYGDAIFDSMSHYSDFNFLSKYPEYNHLISYIDTRKHNWLNFFMNDAEKMVLFKKGLSTAFAFLEKFDWEKYKQIRKDMSHDY